MVVGLKPDLRTTRSYNLAIVITPSLPLYAAPLLAFATALAALWWLVKGNAPKILDHPNARSLHSQAVSRTGGLGLMAGVLVSWILMSEMQPFSLWAGVMMLVSISLADDVASLPVWSRFLVHGIAAAWFAITLLSGEYSLTIILLATLAIVWMTNLYNFMDGSDGLAGGMTFFGFGFYGVAAWLAGDVPFAVINFCVAAAALAFLLFNFHPAKVFMGDAGSIPLGFLAAGLGLIGWQRGLWLLWLPLWVFSPFIADASATLAKRAFRREKIWQAHKEHYYQRLVQSGFGHRNTALLAYVLMLASGGSAVWAASQSGATQFVVGSVWCLIYVLLFWWFDRHNKRVL